MAISKGLVEDFVEHASSPYAIRSGLSILAWRFMGHLPSEVSKRPKKLAIKVSYASLHEHKTPQCS